MSNLSSYRQEGFGNVEGWCAEELFTTVGLLNDVKINKVGGGLEIGVHHGKFYILLNQVVSSDYKSYAVDIFDDQHLNIDGSGGGVLDVFKKNLSLYDVHKGGNTVIIQGDSTDPSLRLREKIGYGAMRFISVDGGHTVEHTLSDLSLANDLVANEGVVILDDILNHHWLGVIEGVGKFLDSRPTLMPFAIGHNKLYLSKLSYRDFYFQLFSNSGLMTKVVNFYGNNIAAL